MRKEVVTPVMSISYSLFTIFLLFLVIHFLFSLILLPKLLSFEIIFVLLQLIIGINLGGGADVTLWNLLTSVCCYSELS